MYSGGYGFGNAAPNFNNNATPQQQQQQQMMYNQQQQFAGMAPQGNFPGASPQMVQGGMMQNAGMPHMGANGQMSGFQQQQQQQQPQPQQQPQQQQFGGSPYGQVAMNPQNFAPNNFMMGQGGMQGFPMQQQGMPQQQTPQMMQQRIPQQQANHPGMNQVSTPQRPPSSAQGTPSNAMPQQQQGQFQPPQHQQATPVQGTAASFPPQPDQGITPNTPTFPQNQATQQGLPAASAVPMSPGTEARDKERFALLLDINHELLYESIQIQTSQQEIKKELAAAGKLTPERKPTEEETILQQDYIQCMRRLQANLSYMATLADRKPETKLPPCPAFLTAPQLTLTVRLRAQPIVPEGSDFKIDPVTDREERDLAIKELYGRLQACYPGVDPNKEPTYRAPGVGPKQANPGFNQPSPTSNKTPQMTNMQPPSTQGGGVQ